MPEETHEERVNRELIELLNELRVALPGVQVLFAFLLAVPFQQRFPRVTDFQQTVYFVTLLSSAAATAFFIAPTAYHRLVFKERDKPMLVQISSKLALAGLGCLAVAMNGAVLLVTDLLFEETTVKVTAALTALLYVGLWFGLGLMRRLAGDRSHS